MPLPVRSESSWNASSLSQLLQKTRKHSNNGRLGRRRCLCFVWLLGILVSTPEAVIRGVFSLIAGFAAAAWALYRRAETPKGTTLKDKKEALRASMETWVSKASDFELHQRLLHDAMREHGAETGWQVLERKIDSYMKAGMTRSQALRKLAEEKGY